MPTSLKTFVQLCGRLTARGKKWYEVKKWLKDCCNYSVPRGAGTRIQQQWNGRGRPGPKDRNNRLLWPNPIEEWKRSWRYSSSGIKMSCNIINHLSKKNITERCTSFKVMMNSALDVFIFRDFRTIICLFPLNTDWFSLLW